MGLMRLCLYVCVGALIAVTSAQFNEIIRPFVQAPALSEQEMAEIRAECNRLIAINDTMSYHVRVPSICSAYAICEHPELGVQPVIMMCPAGLFFNDDGQMNSCVFPSQSNCPGSGDPCFGLPDGFQQDVIRTQPTQGAWYECVGGRTRAGGWCERGEQYLTTNRRCFAIPDLVLPPLPAAVQPPCRLRAVDGEPAKFWNDNYAMDCAPGTQFSLADCTCV